MRKQILLSLWVLCGILGMPFLSTAQMTAYRITNIKSGLVLETGGGSDTRYENGAYVNQWPATTGLNQLWTFQTVQTPNGEGFYIVNLNSGQCLQAADEGLAETRVRTFPRVEGHIKQIWQSIPFYPPIGGFYNPYPSGSINTIKLIGVASGVLRLSNSDTSPGAPISFYPNFVNQDPSDQDPTATHWKIEAVTVPGRFATIQNYNSGHMLEVLGGSTVSGAKVGQWYTNGTPAQGWIIEAVGGGYFTIRNRNSGQVLEIGGATPDAQGTAANQYSYWGGANQQWQLLPYGAPVMVNTYRIINRRTGQALEIGGSDTKSAGKPANQWPFWGGNNQLWLINYQ